MAYWLFWRRRRAQDDDLTREFDVHLALEAEERQANGASPREAALAARRKFGSLALAKEDVRAVWRGARLERMWQDATHGLRQLRRHPGFATVAIFTLSLAVAANSAIFSVIEAVVLRPLPFKDSADLVSIERVTNTATVAGSLAAVHFDEWRRSAQSFAGLALLGGGTFSLTGDGEPENVAGARASANLFQLLVVGMQLGRPFLPEEEERQDAAVILSDALWRRRFGADSNILGRSIRINGAPFVVVGVLPASFRFPIIARAGGPPRPELWVPMTPAAFERDVRSPVFNYAGIGRLRPDVSIAQATAELNTLQSSLAKLSLTRREFPVALVPLLDRVAASYRAALVLVWASVITVLLISCVNVASLLLARAANRTREMAVRSAVGATRTRIAGQMLVESLVLSGVSGGLGIVTAYGLIRLIVAYAPADLPRADEIQVAPRVLLVTLGVVVANGLIFGVVPAWRSSRASPQYAMRVDSRTSTGGRESVRLRMGLVAVEIGLCATSLVVGASLLRSFTRVLAVERGFDVNQILTVTLGVPPTRFPSGQKRAAFLRTALDRIQEVNDVSSVALANVLPLTGDTGPGLTMTTIAGTEDPPTTWLRAVNADYFRTLGIPIVEGRAFREDDQPRAVAMVSNLTAQHLWPGVSALGQQFRIGPQTSQIYKIVFEVIGVTGDTRGESLTSGPAETFYLPYWQDLSLVFNWGFAMRTQNLTETTRAVRTALRQLDPEMPIPAFRTMEDILSGSIAQRRFQLHIVLLFAGAGLLLGSVGLYGLVAYSVAQRTNEIGIRMALGAGAARIQRLIIRQGVIPLMVGLTVGLLAALWAEQLVASLLFGISPRDPVTFAGVAIVLIAVGLAAIYILARRATRINPIAALRYE